MSIRRTYSTCLISVVVACASGRSEGPPRNAAVQAPKAPAWSSDEAQVFADAGVLVIRGVGHAAGIKSFALSCSTATNRARAEMGKVVETWFASTQKCFGCDYNVESSPEEDELSAAMAQASKTLFNDVRILATHVDADRTVHAIVETRIDMPARIKEVNASDKIRAQLEKRVKLPEDLKPPPQIDSIDVCQVAVEKKSE